MTYENISNVSTPITTTISLTWNDIINNSNTDKNNSENIWFTLRNAVCDEDDVIEEYKKNPYNKDLKQQLYQNEFYKRYQHLENEIYFLTLDMNRILNRLTDSKGCQL